MLLYYLRSGLIEPKPSFNDDTKCDECCINSPSAWLNELLLIFGAEPALPLIKLSFCINKFGWDDGLKLFDGIFTGFVLWSNPKITTKGVRTSPESCEGYLKLTKWICQWWIRNVYRSRLWMKYTCWYSCWYWIVNIVLCCKFKCQLINKSWWVKMS